MLEVCIYVVDLEAMASFYSAVLAGSIRSDEDGVCSIVEETAAIVLVTMRPEVAAQPDAPSVALVRTEVAIKACLHVGDLDAATAAVRDHGGAVRGPEWSWHGSRRIDVVDPEGNVVQLVASGA